MPLVVEAAAQRYTEAAEVLHLGGLVNECADVVPKVNYTDPTRVGLLKVIQAGGAR